MKYSDEKLLDEIREANSEVKGPPTYTQFNQREGPSSTTVENRFGKWTTAKRKAGVDETGDYGKLPVNSDYFEEIDSPEKAYWLGVLYGDGSIIGHEPNDRVYLGMIDREHIVKFQDALGASQSISEKNDGIYDITITDQKLVDDLAELGCSGNKTFSDSLPNLSDETHRVSFVRGLFDADGNIGGRGNWFMLTGSNTERFSKLADWIPSESSLREDKDGIARFYVNVGQGVHELWEWLYPDGLSTAPALERKLKQIPK